MNCSLLHLTIQDSCSTFTTAVLRKRANTVLDEHVDGSCETSLLLFVLSAQLKSRTENADCNTECSKWNACREGFPTRLESLGYAYNFLFYGTLVHDDSVVYLVQSCCGPVLNFAAVSGWVCISKAGKDAFKVLHTESWA